MPEPHTNDVRAAIGLLALHVRQLVAHVGTLATLVEQHGHRESAVAGTADELAALRDELLELQTSVTSVASQFAPEGEDAAGVG